MLEQAKKSTQQQESSSHLHTAAIYWTAEQILLALFFLSPKKQTKLFRAENVEGGARVFGKTHANIQGESLHHRRLRKIFASRVARRKRQQQPNLVDERALCFCACDGVSGTLSRTKQISRFLPHTPWLLGRLLATDRLVGGMLQAPHGKLNSRLLLQLPVTRCHQVPRPRPTPHATGPRGTAFYLFFFHTPIAVGDSPAPAGIRGLDCGRREAGRD